MKAIKKWSRSRRLISPGSSIAWPSEPTACISFSSFWYLMAMWLNFSFSWLSSSWSLRFSFSFFRRSAVLPFFFWSSFMSLRFRISANLFTAWSGEDGKRYKSPLALRLSVFNVAFAEALLPGSSACAPCRGSSHSWPSLYLKFLPFALRTLTRKNQGPIFFLNSKYQRRNSDFGPSTFLLSSELLIQLSLLLAEVLYIFGQSCIGFLKLW